MTKVSDPGMQLIRDQRGMLARVADELGLVRSTVSEWERVPAERLSDVERITGITRHLLRPDLAALFSDETP